MRFLECYLQTLGIKVIVCNSWNWTPQLNCFFKQRLQMKSSLKHLLCLNFPFDFWKQCEGTAETSHLTQRARWVDRRGGRGDGSDPSRRSSMLISSFSFLLPCGIRMILFKVSAWAAGLRNLDFMGIIITGNTHTNTHTDEHTHTQIFLLLLTNDPHHQQMIFILKFRQTHIVIHFSVCGAIVSATFPAKLSRKQFRPLSNSSACACACVCVRMRVHVCFALSSFPSLAERVALPSEPVQAEWNEVSGGL